MEDKECSDVRTFYKKFGFLTASTPGHLTICKLRERAECLLEELEEFIQAMYRQDLAAQADALVDLVYFAKGTAVMLGLPWTELWNDVQRANMGKVRGISHRGHPVDCVKPDGWQGPKTEEILRNAGYDKDGRKEHRDDSNVENLNNL